MNRKSKKSKFVHLHVHSHYSLLDGLGKIDDLLDQTKAFGMDSLALTDHGVMYGAVEFFRKAKEKGINPIMGSEVYITPNKMEDKQPKVDEQRYHLVLLAQNETGYKNLIKLVTESHLRGFYYKPRLDKETLARYSEGLVATSACLAGEVPKCILSRSPEKAQKVISEYRDIFGKENFFLEMEPHKNSQDQIKVNQELIKLSRKTGTPLVATCDVHYVAPQDKEIQDILLCIQQNKKVQDRNRLTMSEFDLYLRSPQEMEQYFKDTPQALKNTVEIAERCQFIPKTGEIILPHFEIPGSENEDEYLKKACLRGMDARYGKNPPKEVYERLDFELSVIKKMGYSSYFLIVADFVNWAKDNKIVVGPGRGSAAGSIVSYLTKITNVDPIAFELLFERFLNPERISMPDIDIDFSDDRRDEVLEYVSNKYGHDKVAQIITFGTMAARAAVRDAGRALDYPYDFCDRISKEIPAFTKLKDAIGKSRELGKLYKEDPGAKKILDMAQRLEGVVRHASTHACGVVITQKPLVDYVPLQKATKSGSAKEKNAKKNGGKEIGETKLETPITQFEGKSVEELGLLKMDFLGLKNLTILQNVIDIIRAKYKKEIDLDTIVLDNKKTLELFARGETTGVFQFESAGFKRYLKELKPTRFQDLIDMVALYRPGPMEWIPDYIAGKHNKREITYLHPKLKPILEKTYGIIVVQEQVMEIAKQLAGFTAGEADYLRKAMGKKITKLMDEQRDKFILGCIENGIKGKTAEKIWDFIKPFAGYGFNWAHSACYAMIGYQTAYFKAHYPVEFMAALLSSDEGNTDRIAIEIAECKKMGIPVLPPDVNESYGRFAALGEGREAVIRYGLNAVKNVGHKIAKEIIEERKRGGRFKNIADFSERIESKDFNKKSLESLSKAGALDSLGERAVILANIEKILKFAKEIKDIKRRGQASLFGESFGSSGDQNALILEGRIEIKKRELLSWEKELLGVYITDNPLEEFKDFFQKNVTFIKKFQDQFLGEDSRQSGMAIGSNRLPEMLATIGGVITKVKKIYTKKNQEMAFAELEDLTGKLELVIFPNVFLRFSSLWQEDKIIWARGKINDKDGSLKMLCDEAGEVNEETKDNNLPQSKRVSRNSPRGYVNRFSDNSGAPLPVASLNYVHSNVHKELEKKELKTLCLDYNLDKDKREIFKRLLKGLQSGNDKVVLKVNGRDGADPIKVKISGSFSFDGEAFSSLTDFLGKEDVKWEIQNLKNKT